MSEGISPPIHLTFPSRRKKKPFSSEHTNMNRLKTFLILGIVTITFGAGGGSAEGGPMIRLTQFPKKGSDKNLKGKVKNANWRKYRIAVYIFTDGWRNRPSVNKAKTRIKKDGTWEVDVTTRPGDANARFIVAYLIPRNYNPPRMAGQEEIPTTIDNFAPDFALRQRN